MEIKGEPILKPYGEWKVRNGMIWTDTMFLFKIVISNGSQGRLSLLVSKVLRIKNNNNKQTKTDKRRFGIVWKRNVY